MPMWWSKLSLYTYHARAAQPQNVNNHRSLSMIHHAALLLLVIAPAVPAETPYPAKVSDNGRFLLDQHDKGFFWLADTAWELFHRCNREDAEFYLKNRAAKKFNVIQAVVLAELAGLVEPNPYGHLPLTDNDPAKPQEDYFKHVDWIVNKADELGLVIGMLPTWGDKWNKKWGQGPEIFTPENAAAFGEFLGGRYQDKPILWILGGDRPVEDDRQRGIIRAMAAGLRKGDGGRHLMTYHPMGGKTSADYFPDEGWLAFHMLQSGHNYDNPNYDRIAADYARQPTRPCLDGEPGYEDHPAGVKAANGYLDDYDARHPAYWPPFARPSRHPDAAAGGARPARCGPDAACTSPARIPAPPGPGAGPVAPGVRPRSGHRPRPGDTGRGRELRPHLLGVGQAVHRGPGQALGRA